MLPTGMKMGCARGRRAWTSLLRRFFGCGNQHFTVDSTALYWLYLSAELVPLHVGQYSERRARTGRVFAPLGFLGPSERHAEAGHAHTEPLRKLLLLLDHLE